ncbi:hypothetical protein NL676_020942 [Syzygium grande]|nr:hypothetical protein NL676_020942 [Syzygium grande]
MVLLSQKMGSEFVASFAGKRGQLRPCSSFHHRSDVVRFDTSLKIRRGGGWEGGWEWIVRGWLKGLVRRKQVDSARAKSGGGGHHQLPKELSVLHLITIGVGSTIGAGVYILVGTVAREHSGPTLTFSFLIAGIAAALSAFCYAELASRCPSAGSTYHYSYICVGEG